MRIAATEDADARADLFVGREREATLIEELLAGALDGRLRVLLLAGEPGIGKSRLLGETERQARRAGAKVLRGGASDSVGMPPYLPFLEAIGSHARTVDEDTLRRQVGTGAEALSGLLPELAPRFGAASSVAVALPPDQARHRLYAAAGELLAAVAADSGLVLLLDDLHWADAATLDLLCQLARAQSSARLLVVAAARSEEAEGNAAFQRAQVELNRLRVLTTLPVKPLAATDLSLLAGSIVGGNLTAGASQALLRHSEGNPFFAEELMREWRESGKLLQGRDGWQIEAAGSQPLPATLTAAIRQRLARFSPKTVDRLRVAAIVGRTFDVDLLARITQDDPESLAEQLQVVARGGLIEEVGETAFRFTHDKVRECLYQEVTGVRRRRLHGAIGQAFEDMAGSDGQRLADLAFHFTRAGDPERGARYAQQAGDAALDAFAASAACDHFRDALRLMDTASSARNDLLLRLGQAAMLAGEDRAAAEVLDQACAGLSQGERVPLSVAFYRLGQARTRLEEHSAAYAAFSRALALLDGTTDDDELRQTVLVLVELANLAMLSLGQLAQGGEYARQAQHLAQRLGDPRLVATTTRTLGNLLVRVNDLPGGIRLLEEALELAASLDDAVEAAECCGSLAIAYIWQGPLRRAREVTERRETFALRAHDPYQLRHIRALLALAACLKGDLAEADRLGAEARTQVNLLQSPEPVAFARFGEAWLAWFKGDLSDALAAIREAADGFRPLGPNVAIWYIGVLALMEASAGNRAEATAAARETERLVEMQPPGSMSTAEPLSHLAQTALLLGDVEQFQRHVPRLQAFAGQQHDAAVDRLLGEDALLRGDLGAARQLFGAAEAQARVFELGPELVQVLRARARLELALSPGEAGRAQARATLESVLDQCQAHGWVLYARQVQADLDALGRRNRPQPGGLSEREVEVLRLVVDGMTNAQIAAALVISEKTVTNHLTSVFNKLGVDNRAAAAAYAIRNQIA